MALSGFRGPWRWAVFFSLCARSHVIQPADCPHARWIGVCKGTATCQSLAHAGLTCEGIMDVDGCDVQCSQPCCIATTTTTGTHTHTETSTSVTHTMTTTATKSSTLTSTATTLFSATEAETTPSEVGTTVSRTEVTEPSTTVTEETTSEVMIDTTVATTAATTSTSTTAGTTTLGPAALMRLAMRVQVTDVGDYREYFEDSQVRRAYIHVMHRAANVSQEMVNVTLNTPSLGYVVVVYTITIPYKDGTPSIPLELIERRLASMTMQNFQEMLDAQMDLVTGVGQYQQKIVSVTVMQDLPVNAASLSRLATMALLVAGLVMVRPV